MSTINTHYLAKFGAEDAYIDSAAHDVPVSSDTTRSVTGLAAYFHRIDGTGTAGTGDWLTTGKMTASYFVAVHSSTPSVFPVATVSTTLNVVNASTFQVDATSLDCAVAANFTAAVTLTAGLTSNAGVFGSSIPLGSEALKAEAFRVGTLVVDGASTLTGNVSVGGNISCAGNVSMTGTLTVVSTTTHTGAVALNGGATVPSGQTLTVASGATLTVGGTLTIASFTASTAVIAGASGGSEVLKTTTFRATGASALVGAVSMSSTLSVAGTASFAGISSTGTIAATSAGGINNAGAAVYFQHPTGADTSSSATLDLDALETANSHEFNPTSAQRDITTVTGTVKGFFWFVNKHASNAVTIATGYMAYPSGQFTIAADSTALLYWDTSTNKFTAVAKIS